MKNTKLTFLIFFYLKYFLIGLISGEAFQLFISSYIAVDSHLIEKDLLYNLFEGLFILTSVSLLFYFWFEETFEPILKFFKHNRYDILIVGFIGLCLSIYTGVIAKSLYNLVDEHLTPDTLDLIVSGLLVVVFVSTTKSLITPYEVNESKNVGSLLSDEPIVTPEQDLLGLNDQAMKFADKIDDNGSSQSMVYGMDAPWGVGKTSFVNLMKAHWNSKLVNNLHTSKLVVFNFEPLRFSKDENLSDRFVEETIYAISKEFPVPELTSLLGGYSKYLKGLSSVSLFGFQFGFNAYQSNDDFKIHLENFLKKEDVKLKLIVIIEDLDRISLKEAKQILYSMKSAFDLPNVSYVVCYDSQNLIDTMNKGTVVSAESRCSADNYAKAKIDGVSSENLLEFLEKFVQLKVPIYLEKDNLIGYLNSTKAQLVEGKGFVFSEHFLTKLVSVVELMLGKGAERGCGFYFNEFATPSKDFHYEKIIRDPRKIKRLINHLVFMGFPNEEEMKRFDENDFVHLLLIYITYPNVFRHIYKVEMASSSGFFTNEPSGTDNENIKEKSDFYEKYKNGLDEDAAFLLEQVFGRKDYDEKKYEEKDFKKIAARYPQNIEHYLKLITQQQPLPKESSHKYQLEVVYEALENLSKIDELYQHHDDLLKGESNYKYFWLYFVEKLPNVRESFSQDKVNDLISKLLVIIPLHSEIEFGEVNVGLRGELPRRLLKVLDSIGWDFNADGGRNNTPENLQLLAHRILGIEKYENLGILDALFNKGRGVLGLNDLMHFRLSMSPDRRGNFFNINRALASYKTPKEHTDNQNSTIESMRDVSQAVFWKFKQYYINKKVNLFDEIDSLDLDKLSSGRADYILQSSIEESKINAVVQSTKSRLKAFISYQLGNMKIDSGIGCGYFDEEGNGDNNGINKVYNDYLFNIVFNPKKSDKAHKHFLNYLLINSSSRFYTGSDKLKPNLEKLMVVLNLTKLKHHIKTFEESLNVELQRLTKEDKYIVIGEVSEYYKNYQQDIIEFFDEILSLKLDKDDG